MVYMITILFTIAVLYIVYKGLAIMLREMHGEPPKRRGCGTLGTGGRARLAHNRRGHHLIMHSNGAVSTDINQLLRDPNVQEDIRAAGRLYKAMVLEALLTGKSPPRQYGDFLPMNKERLLAEWDDDWQAVMDDVGLDYNTFFGIKEELTAEEIAAQYVEKERTSKSTIRGYARSNRSLRL